MVALPETDFQRQYRERKEREDAEKKRMYEEVLAKTNKRLLSMGFNPKSGKRLNPSPGQKQLDSLGSEIKAILKAMEAEGQALLEKGRGTLAAVKAN